jgi:uncharacterized protein DUF3175
MLLLPTAGKEQEQEHEQDQDEGNRGMGIAVMLAVAKKKKKAKKPRKWSSKIKTVSTFPPEGTFTKDAKTVARIMASKQVSPKGIGSGIRMVTMFINRAGKNLSASQKKELEKAKRILQQKQARQEANKK